MSTAFPHFTALLYESATTSTSPETNGVPTVDKPSVLMQVGTSALAQGALLLALWAHDAAPSRMETARPAQVREAPPRPPATAVTARSSEMVGTILSMFGLNRSQAADVMRVRRQSIYNWLGGAEAEGANLDRMLSLYDMARSLDMPIEPHLAVRQTADGASSLLRMLSADRLDRAAILAWTRVLLRPDELAWPPPLDEVLKEAGIPRDIEKESRLAADGIRHIQG